MDITTTTPDQSTASRQGDWYLVQCKPRQDERAEENLVRQGYECSRPACQRVREVRGKHKVVLESLFPGYLFIHMPRGANWAPLRSSRGVARVVAFGGQPVPVGQGLVEQLQARAQTAVLSPFKPGDKVTVRNEGFTGLDSIFMCMDGEERVILLINLMNRQQKISLPVASIVNG